MDESVTTHLLAQPAVKSIYADWAGLNHTTELTMCGLVRLVLLLCKQ